MPPQEPLSRVLIVGAGAVGQVYARHLQLAGVQVDFFVKEKYADLCRDGLWLYPLNDKKLRDDGTHMDGFGVFTSAESLRDESFDQVWLCVSSPALQGEWLLEVLEAAAPKTLVSLTPGFKDRALLETVFSGDLVLGLIHFISYQSPLALPSGWPTTDWMEKEVLRPHPGMAYWLPPRAKGPFSGPDEAVKATVAALKRGGFPAKVDQATRAKASFGSSVLIPIIVALEAEDWRFANLMKSPRLKLALRASKEAMVAISKNLGVGRPFWRHFLSAWMVRRVIGMARRIIPFDIEVYLAYHFTKVGDQTVAMIDAFHTLAQEEDVEAPSLAELKRLHSKG